MKVKIKKGMLFLMPETKKEKNKIIKWQKKVLENYDDLFDWMFWVEKIGGDNNDSVFKKSCKIYGLVKP